MNSFRDRIPALSFDRPVTVLMSFLALMVVGLIAYQRIPVQMLPSGMDQKFLFVRIVYPNSAPLETDDRIVRPVEEQLSTVGGLKFVRSTAGNGFAIFRLNFWGATDMDDAYNTVVDRLERAMPELPDDVQRYQVYRFNPDDSPILWIGGSLGPEVEDPYHLLERVIKPQLERISGVASADIYGVPKNIVAVEYERDKIFAHGLDLGSVQRRLASDNFQMGSGKIEENGQIRPLRALSSFTADDLQTFPVRDSLVLGDIAQIRRGGVLSADIWRVNGKEGAAIAVKKEAGANTQKVCAEVAEVLAQIERDPRSGGTTFHVLFDQGALISESVGTLVNTALTGGLMALVILYLFLREWRMTLLIAASIPLSLLLTIAGLYFMGMDLNIISLMGLMLAVGMVVDNAIVVVETIYQQRGAGASIRDAAIKGTAEVNLAILASTATTMVVFLPVMLMSENAQLAFFMKVMGMPVVLALAASLLVALVYAPLATRYMGEADIRPDPAWLEGLKVRYQRLLTAVLRRRGDTTIALLAAGFLTMAIAVPGVDCGGDADQNLNDFVVRFDVPPQAGARERDEIVAAFEKMMSTHAEEWGVRAYSAELDGGGNEGDLHAYLVTGGPMSREDVMKAAKKVLPDNLPGVTATIGWANQGGSSNTLELSIHGEDMRTLLALGNEVERRLESVEGVIGASVEQDEAGLDEIQIVLQRDALARYGVGASQIGQTVAFSLRPNQLTPLQEDNREVELRSSFTLKDRSDIDTVLDFDIWSPVLQSLVPIRVLSTMVFDKGPVSINRKHGRTSVNVKVDLAESTNVQKLYPRIEEALADMAFPRGTGWSKGEQFDKQQEDNASLQLALLLSVCFVFLLIGMLFESFLLPIGIISTIPMAMFGSMWGLYLTGTPMDMMAGIGLVVLVGVVVNNGIVLVDLVTQLRSEGMERQEALVEAGGRRLRPILMTALTTISGLLPMAMGSSAFIGLPYAPLGRTVISGLTVGTLLTLVLVPFLYAWMDDFSISWRRWIDYVVDRPSKTPPTTEAT